MKDDRAKFDLKVPKELIVPLRQQANEKGVALNSLFLKILWDYVEKSRNRKEG